MGKIVLLDDLTINKIAAGEVIERPASVVKEMMENSIDAGATKITVEIKNGGISFIRISDNGKGISDDDMEIAFERHATSKIRVADDILNVTSMGFRGEALASIAAISNVEMISRTADSEIGHKIVVEGGKVLTKEEIGAPIGTTITVTNLFYNTPVRYKFLKKDYTESGYIEDTISRLALVNTDISFKLINSGKTVIQTNGNGKIADVIYNIYGKDVAESVIYTEYELEGIKAKGVVGKPSIARSNRSNQLFFINGRYVKDRTLNAATEQAFKPYIPASKYGFVVLNLEMDPSTIDVNVHPAKLEVRFEDENKVYRTVYHTIQEAIEKSLSEKKEDNENTANVIFEKQDKKTEESILDIQRKSDEVAKVIKEDESFEKKSRLPFFKKGKRDEERPEEKDNLLEEIYKFRKGLQEIGVSEVTPSSVYTPIFEDENDNSDNINTVSLEDNNELKRINTELKGIDKKIETENQLIDEMKDSRESESTTEVKIVDIEESIRENSDTKSSIEMNEDDEANLNTKSKMKEENEQIAENGELAKEENDNTEPEVVAQKFDGEDENSIERIEMEVPSEEKVQEMTEELIKQRQSREILEEAIKNTKIEIPEKTSEFDDMYTKIFGGRIAPVVKEVNSNNLSENEKKVFEEITNSVRNSETHGEYATGVTVETEENINLELDDPDAEIKTKNTKNLNFEVTNPKADRLSAEESVQKKEDSNVEGSAQEAVDVNVDISFQETEGVKSEIQNAKPENIESLDEEDIKEENTEKNNSEDELNEQDKGINENAEKQESLLNDIRQTGQFEEFEKIQTKDYRVIGVAFEAYIIAEINGEMVIIDGQAANEKLLREKIKKSFNSNEKDSQIMLLPDIINLTYKETELIKENISLFQKAGFDLDAFGENTIKLISVPSMCIDMNTKHLFLELLDETEKYPETIEERENRFIRDLAYKVSARLNMKWNEKELKDTMDELMKNDTPFNFEDGQSIVTRMTKYEIERKFSRK